MKKIIRQGDVMLISTKQKRSEELVENPQKVVALGETSGHSHRFESGATVLARPENINLGRFIEVEEPTKIKHQEHKEIPLLLGSYRAIHQRIFSKVQIIKIQD